MYRCFGLTPSSAIKVYEPIDSICLYIYTLYFIWKNKIKLKMCWTWNTKWVHIDYHDRAADSTLSWPDSRHRMGTRWYMTDSRRRMLTRWYMTDSRHRMGTRWYMTDSRHRIWTQWYMTDSRHRMRTRWYMTDRPTIWFFFYFFLFWQYSKARCTKLLKSVIYKHTCYILLFVILWSYPLDGKHVR